MKTKVFRKFLAVLFLTILMPTTASAVIDKGCWGTITVYLLENKTVTSQFDAPSPAKVKSMVWSASQYSDSPLGDSYEIISQNGKTCEIRGVTFEYTGKLYCKMRYGDTDYIAYYNIKTISRGKLTVTANPTGGTVSEGSKVYLSCDVSGATIFYTTDGSDPIYNSDSFQPTNGYLYTSSGITINKTTTIKAFAAKKGYTSSGYSTWKYTVIERVPVNGITLNKTSLSLQKEQEEQLIATVKPDNATDKTVTWSIKPEGIAIVSSSGLVTAKAEGSATITCKANDGSGVTATCSVTVTRPEPTAISIPKTLVMLIRDTYKLDYSLTPDGVSTTVAWSSDKPTVATVDNSGNVKPVSVGTANITVKTANGKTSTCQVTILDKSYVMEGNVKQVVAGIYHTMILKTDGTLWACGGNGNGQLGDGTTTKRTTPIKVMEDVASVSVFSNTMILKTDGTLWACGYNYYGQLGDGTTTDRATPVKVMEGVASVSIGLWHTMILKTDGTLWACGYNYYGQLGDGTTTDRATPVKVMDGVASVSAGELHTMIIKTDGSLWACGDNYSGQLGDGTTTNRTTPVKVMDSVASVSADGDYTMILKTDGTLWACGNNYSGQLGDGTTTNRTTPVKVMDSVASVSAGRGTMILKTDGTLWACGGNDYGQLGDGTTTKRTTPIKVMEGVASVSASYNHTMILKTDGTLWACGWNKNGQLGDGTNVDRPTPVKIGNGSPGGVTPPDSDWKETDISKIANVIYLDKVEGTSGSQLTLSLKMKNTARIRGFQFDMYLPDGVKAVKNNKGRISASISKTRLDADDEHTLTVAEQSDGALRFLCGSQYDETFSGTDGEVATLTVSIDSNMEDGDYQIKLKDIKLTETDISKYYETAEVIRTLTVSSFTPGDINGDGKVDVSDYIGVANHILGSTPTGFIEKAADVDGSGTIDVSDYIGIANIILTGNIYGTAKSHALMRAATNLDSKNNVIYVAPLSVEKGTTTAKLSIRMKNSAAIRGFQFDLYLPDNVTAAKNAKGRITAALTKARLADDDEHTLTVAEQADGAIRFLCGSQYDESFTGNDGEVATLTVNIPEGLPSGDYPVILKTIKLTETDISKYYETEYMESTLTIPDVSADVQDVKMGSDTFNIYTQAGVLLKREVTTMKGLAKGVYIVISSDGQQCQKVVVK